LGIILPTQERLLSLLDHVLSLNGRAMSFTRDTALLGSVPELDSMAVVAVLTALEEQFDFTADDDEIDGSTFASVGSLLDFVESKLGA
jgi:acyl carrier protein